MNKELPPFKTGDRVVCTTAGDWYWNHVRKIAPGPSKNEESIISGVCPDGWILLEEYPTNGEGYDPYWFRLIDPYSEDCREELAQAAMTDKIETDGVVREIVKN